MRIRIHLAKAGSGTVPALLHQAGIGRTQFPDGQHDTRSMRGARNAVDGFLESSPATLRPAMIMERRVPRNKWGDVRGAARLDGRAKGTRTPDTAPAPAEAGRTS